MTPGTYLRKRRETAGISIDQTANFLANLPIAYGSTPAPMRREMLATALRRVEADIAILSADHARIVKAAFPFDTRVYALLAEGRPAPRLCRECACSTFDPCDPHECPCAWSETDPTLCTKCEFVIKALRPGFFAPSPKASPAPSPISAQPTEAVL